MAKISAESAKFILGNFIPPFQVLVCIWVVLTNDLSTAEKFGAAFVWIYLVPPLFVRIMFGFFGKPIGVYKSSERGFWLWYFAAQSQALYLRFGFLEEILRVFPLFYSNWLRLWGAKVGPMVYWAPRVNIMDRTHLEIGARVLVGYGAGMTSHHLNRIEGETELVLSIPRLENGAVMGGLSGIGPGSRVAEGETLPSTLALAPFYLWKDGRRHAGTSTQNQVDAGTR